MISVFVLFELLECLDDIVHAGVIYGSMNNANHTFEFELHEILCDEDSLKNTSTFSTRLKKSNQIILQLT